MTTCDHCDKGVPLVMVTHLAAPVHAYHLNCNAPCGRQSYPWPSRPSVKRRERVVRYNSRGERVK